ncbi:prephenate dehydratase [Halocalculus aciditolerans]|uniref:Prephenate dehydratase n=1 Tax=Halocalculus aciditolerans TaxID=1383812 RepID=A0A830EYW4_9EURY|nr:prephenate dehydratase [Halocalculus aciditolerans]GGL45806.1 prephenate dehydratase [Halocalculus aciditolerans]
MQVVTLGPSGTYSHRAAKSIADDADIDFRESVHAIVGAVSAGDADRGVVPIENSIEGSVTETLDTLAEEDVAVVKEVVTPIRHALLSQTESVKTVASHSQALAQCRDYIETNYPDADVQAVASTARGVELARENEGVAGIGHPDNAGDDLLVLGEDIQDQPSNATRFFVVAPPEDRSEAGGKSSFVVYPNANYPGLLLELLTPFADRDVNLSRVESRPSGERLGDYVFHVDVDAGLYEDRTQAAVAEIEALAESGWVRTLGSYDVTHVV